MIISEEDHELMHYGILRRSGRYPWGSGGDVETRSRDFLSYVGDMRKQGLSDTEIARGVGLTTTEFRAANSSAKNATKQADIGMAQRLKDKGYSNVAIGKRMGINESSVRALLAPGSKDKADVLASVSNQLRDAIHEKKYIDVGTGVENQLGITRDKLNVAISQLKEEGYKLHYVKVTQLGTGLQTSVKVMTKGDVPYSEVFKNRDQIQQVRAWSEDGGRTFSTPQKPLNISSTRVGVRYAEDGGSHADGVIYVRPGVEDVSLGKAPYAQVRISVDGTHYLKGMAMYKDDLPAGIDLLFNTNKSNTGNKLDAMKKQKDDPTNPFGATVRQIPKLDAHGREIPNTVRSVMNLVNEAGNWDTWSRNLPSQFLSKQSPTLAKTQLDMLFERKQNQFKEIMSLTNPTVRQKLLQEFSDSVDSSAVNLKAAALPRQATKVILPMNSLKENEVYAPTFNNGERVVLVRFPHGGTFELPELTVNNRNQEAKKTLGAVPDAIGIHHKVAARLSGADFDGDSVLVIPNNAGKIKTSAALEGLKGFDPQHSYPPYEGMKRMTPREKGIEMGKVSNLITDMTIQGASPQELARAVRHSMVVIDAEKHNLNYKQSAIDNGIAQLSEKYQGRKSGGASTLISRASGEIRLPNRKARPAAEGGAIDRITGEKRYVNTNESFTGRDGKVVIKKFKSQKLAETNDANTLSSGTQIEKIYADHSNKLKALANQARLEMVHTKGNTYSPSAAKTFKDEVSSLRAKLNVAKMNAPLERQAQIIGNSIYRAKLESNPHLEPADLKKIRAQSLAEARARTGAAKQQIHITDEEWRAIQAGAITNHMLTEILKHANSERVKQLALPKESVKMSATMRSRAQQMLNSGYTQAEVAQQLGVSVSTLQRSIGGE